MACAKICCELTTGSGITARRNFHRICIAGKILLVKQVLVMKELFLTNDIKSGTWYHILWPVACFTLYMLFYHFVKSYCGDKTIIRPWYLYNGTFYTDICVLKWCPACLKLLPWLKSWSFPISQIKLHIQFNSIQKGLLPQIHQYLQHIYIQVFCNNEGYWSKKCLLVPQWNVSLTNYLRDGISVHQKLGLLTTWNTRHFTCQHISLDIQDTLWDNNNRDMNHEASYV